MRYRWIFNDDLLGFQWLVQVGGDDRSALEWYTERFQVPMPANWEFDSSRGVFAAHPQMQYAGLIWLEDDVRVSTSTHEVAHAVVHVCTVLDMDPRQANEFQALYTGWLNKHITRTINKYDDRKAKAEKDQLKAKRKRGRKRVERPAPRERFRGKAHSAVLRIHW